MDLSQGLENVPVLIEGSAGGLTFPKFQVECPKRGQGTIPEMFTKDGHTIRSSRPADAAMSAKHQCKIIRLKYSPDNIEGPGCTIDPSEVSLPGCSCLAHSCLTESCSCLQTYGQAYEDTATLSHLRKTDSGSCPPVFECHALCSCSDACSNRVVQRGLRLRLEVYSTKNRGWGVRTLEPIPKGAFVCEYAGEVVSFDEARSRQLAQKVGENNYIIAVREHGGSGSITETFVDPAIVGNVGRFLNHACQPNLFMQPVRVHSLVPRLALFAGRDIDAHEELTFDYSGGYTNQPPLDVLSTQSVTPIPTGRTDEPQRKECRCGANNCTKFLPLDLSILN